jgi:hypothetical protein
MYRMSEKSLTKGNILYLYIYSVPLICPSWTSSIVKDETHVPLNLSYHIRDNGFTDLFTEVLQMSYMINVCSVSLQLAAVPETKV